MDFTAFGLLLISRIAWAFASVYIKHLLPTHFKKQFGSKNTLNNFFPKDADQ